MPMGRDCLKLRGRSNKLKYKLLRLLDRLRSLRRHNHSSERMVSQCRGNRADPIGH